MSLFIKVAEQAHLNIDDRWHILPLRGLILFIVNHCDDDILTTVLTGIYELESRSFNIEILDLILRLKRLYQFLIRQFTQLVSQRFIAQSYNRDIRVAKLSF